MGWLSQFRGGCKEGHEAQEIHPKAAFLVTHSTGASRSRTTLQNTNSASYAPLVSTTLVGFHIEHEHERQEFIATAGRLQGSKQGTSPTIYLHGGRNDDKTNMGHVCVRRVLFLGDFATSFVAFCKIKNNTI